jgi:N-acetylmuramoyl-L-alanine amidase
MPPIKACVGHYTAGPIAHTDAEAVRLWWNVRAQHMAQGWSNIGYHIGLGPEGGIYLLRPRSCVGAHTLGYNTGYIGFSVHGTTGDTWTPAQLKAYRYAIKHFGYSSLRVYGHNDLNPTGCPGSFKAKYVSKGQ